MKVWAFFLMLMAAPLAAHAQSSGDALYRHLGERAGIANIIDHAMAHFTTDARIKTYFEDTNIDRLKGMLTDYFQLVAGGPDVYRGSRDMHVIHAGMHLRNADFNALVEDLQQGMDEAGIPFAMQNRLLARMAPKRREIVTQ